MSKRGKENLMQGADAEQLTRGIAPDFITGQGDARELPTEPAEFFDPTAALQNLGIAGLPQEIELPERELDSESDTNAGVEAVRSVHEYGGGVSIDDADGHSELVLGHGVGVALPAVEPFDLSNNSVLKWPDGGTNIADPITEDAYAEQRARQKDGPLAMRFNEGKLRFDLIPPEAIEGLAGIYTMGAVKYADRNWEKGLQLMGCFASLMRHAWKWAGGEDLDPESKMHHMDHVAWNAVAISTFFKRGRKDLDDRPGV